MTHVTSSSTCNTLIFFLSQTQTYTAQDIANDVVDSSNLPSAAGTLTSVRSKAKKEMTVELYQKLLTYKNGWYIIWTFKQMDIRLNTI